MPKGVHRPLYTKSLVLITLNVIAVSAILAAYDVEVPIRPTVKWAASQLYQIKYVRGVADWVTSRVGFIWKVRTKVVQPKRHGGADKSISELMTNAQHLPVFTHDQLALFDGTRPAKPVYLAILGRIYDVEKGRKHYAPGGGYHFFSGKDATRAFVTGDFTPEGLVDDVGGLSEQDLLSILDWIKFYEKDYKLVGVLQGTYYDAHGKLTEAGQNVLELLERAAVWKEKQLREQEVFPPCNSEWHKDVGGRVWCSAKSGGVKREWVGVPRKLFVASSKTHRCACVKNFGPPLASPGEQGNRGDLDNPNLREYEGCSPTANSCKIE
ncbi:Cytochrome b5-like Heme/Steroid binding domain containing protein [Aphelenchoides avenae]|nr:Cytochrome b5-like Heme/Steroid binding domain containing protein [Aphelenchus avenae]